MSNVNYHMRQNLLMNINFLETGVFSNSYKKIYALDSAEIPICNQKSFTFCPFQIICANP